MCHCESQQSLVDLLTSSVFTYCSSFVVSMVTSPFISIVWCFRPYKPYIFWKLIIWWWQWPRRILTKRQRHTDTDKYKVLPRPNACYMQGVQGFKILYWLSSCDDKDKDTILWIIRAEYFSGVNIFPGWKFFRYTHGLNIWLSHNLLGLVSFYFDTLQISVLIMKTIVGVDPIWSIF